MNKHDLILNIMFFPFKDITFYESDLLSEVAKNPKKSNNQKELIRKLQVNIMKKCRINSVDEINLIAKKYYPWLFNSIEKKNVDFETFIYKKYFEIIKKVTQSMISIRDGEIIYKYWKRDDDKKNFGIFDETEKAILFSDFNRIIPIDMFVAEYFAVNNITDIRQLDGFYQNINLADAPLHDILVKGISENHIHASAAFNFTSLWQLLMNHEENKSYLSNFKMSIYSNFNSVEELQKYILIASIIRLIISLYLKYQCNQEDIFQWVDKNGFDKRVWNYIQQPSKYEDIKCSDLKEFFEDIKVTFSLTDVNKRGDILFSVFTKEKNIKTYGENIFLFKSFKYIKDQEDRNNTDSYNSFCKLFFKYIMIKNEFYQQVTQKQSVNGLDFFQDYFASATKGFDKKNITSYYPLMLRSLFQNQYLKQVELRFSFPEKLKQFRGIIYEFLLQYKNVLEEDFGIDKESLANIDFPRIGLIYHLIKQKDNIEKCWNMYEEDNILTSDKLYYGKAQDKYIRQIDELIKLRNEIPYLSDFIVGIDAASLENNTPIQIFAPVFSKARDSVSDRMLHVDRNGNKIRFKSLFFTFHAGEDFRHIISGLRRIDEVIEHCKFHSGDRIGHGIALGISIDEWTKKNDVSILPRGEYLDNLLWIWGIYAQNISFNAEINIYLEHKIYNLAKDIFICTNGINVQVLYECYQNRFSELNTDKKDEYVNKKNLTDKAKNKKDDVLCINKIKYGNQVLCFHADEDKVSYWDAKKIEYAYHCKCYLERLEEPIYVETHGIEKDIAIEIQKYLIDKIAMKGIVLEVNPTSNAVIGDMKTVYENQIFNINNLDSDDYKNIIVCVASDDPIVFNTNLSNEISYLYYGMINKGYGKEKALEWIDKIRENGMQVSFIDTHINNQEYYRRLCCALEELGDIYN